MASQLKVCSCIVFFSGLSFLINHLISLSGLPIPQILPLILTGITEMTLGIKRLSEYALTPLTFGLSAFFLGFGGISIAAQVYSVTRTKKTRQPFGGYLVWKLLFGLILSLLFFGSALLYRHLDV